MSNIELDDNQRNLMAQALVLAADRYVCFAVDAAGRPGGTRLMEQFLRQAADVRSIAIRIGDGGKVAISGHDRVSREDAARITNQQFADALKERADSLKGASV